MCRGDAFFLQPDIQQTLDERVRIDSNEAAQAALPYTSIENGKRTDEWILGCDGLVYRKIQHRPARLVEVEP